MQAYARKLGQCLLEIATGTDSSRAQADMQRCTMETHALNLCVAMSNPRGFSKFHSQRLDGLPGVDNSHLSDTFYVEMLVNDAVELQFHALHVLHLHRRTRPCACLCAFSGIVLALPASACRDCNGMNRRVKSPLLV